MLKHILCLSCVVMLLLTARSAAGAQSGKLVAKFFDVGQADASLITCPDGQHKLLIDAADNRYPASQEKFRNAMTQAFSGGNRRIEVVVSSHPHADHISSMNWVLTNFTVGTYVDNGQKYDSTTFGTLETTRRKLVKNGQLKYIDGRANSFNTVNFCPLVEVQLLSAWAVQEMSDPNDRSVAVRIKHGERTFLFLGDIEGEAEHVMLSAFTPEQHALLNVDVLKVGHHGSDTSSGAELINAVSPQAAVVSCGDKDVGTNKGYKHPRLSTIRNYDHWFKNLGTNHPSLLSQAPSGNLWAYDALKKKWVQEKRPAGVWFTPHDGAITIRSDGQTLEVERENP